MAEKPAHEILHDYLLKVSVGSCTCGTKSPDVPWHQTNCFYAILAQALDHSDAVAAEVKELREKIKAAAQEARTICGEVCTFDCGPETGCVRIANLSK